MIVLSQMARFAAFGTMPLVQLPTRLSAVVLLALMLSAKSAPGSRMAMEPSRGVRKRVAVGRAIGWVGSHCGRVGGKC